VTTPAAIQTPTASTVITQVPAVSIATVTKRKYRGRPEQEEGPLPEPKIMFRSLSLEELRGIKILAIMKLSHLPPGRFYTGIMGLIVWT